MIKAGTTVKDAAQEWVNGFDAIQQGMIKKLMDAEPEEWREVTKPAVGDRVYVYEECACGEVLKHGKNADKFRVKMDNGKEIWVKTDGMDVEHDYRLPIWGTMWSFHDPCDLHWLEEGEGLAVMSKCGFRIFESDEFGYFFGIDGAGYDFYEQHWIPLYKARGLHWHDPATETEVVA